MDAPLLALTRRGKHPLAEVPVEIAGRETMRQLVQLRWIAVAGQLLTILAVRFGLAIPLPLGFMLGVVGMLALANLGATVMLPRYRITNVELMLALLVDIGSLTAQLHFSGGATNPFISFYLLQVVLGAILLEIWSAWVLIAVTGLCFAGLTINSVPLALPPELQAERGELYAWGAWISFVLTAMLLALFIMRLIRNLRAREQYLADLRQQAAEEDGIVRMGLFASGAAHELGTPLASLSVILSDWRRMPRLAKDAELMAEIDDMQAEVERCKAIVTDILHSAGEPRVEAMGSTVVLAFLNEIVADWRTTHAGVPFQYHCGHMEGAAVVGSASLRQAIWNLLDNAAEASPAGIALTASHRGGELVIAVSDRGPGFADAQLATIGTPYQSSKGAGHGVGLFLAANVARRSGGRLEAINRPDGGAEVRLVLPLAAATPKEK
jgi:two-component system sensor histidine kinase RegB